MPDPKPAPKKKRGRKPILDPELVAATLAELQGNIMATAKRYNVHRSSVQELIGKRPALQKVLLDAREGMKDHAESSLYRAVIAGEAWAVCFYLKTQAKDRGYVEKTEHKVEVESPPVTEIIVRSREEAKAVLALLAAKS